MTFPTLTPAQIAQYFGPTPQPADGNFEIALVLGGTVSAGAYTAGVLDFLIEALEEWTRQKTDPNYPQTPRHNVVIRFITGTSGGGVNAAIAARVLAYKFPHVVRGTPTPDKGTGNPFYDIWVNQLDLSALLKTDDIVGGKVNSVLSGTVLDQTALAIEQFSAEPPPPRPYIASPLSVILTMTNLRGVPYRLDMGTGAQAYIDHADHARFAFVYDVAVAYTPRPDEFVLGFNNGRLQQQIDWQTFGQFALATSAFPVGLPARNLARPYAHYQYRVMSIPTDSPGGAPVVKQLIPDWDALLPAGEAGFAGDYHFVAVDGGVTDNEPIQLARTALAGYGGRNPRDGMRAKRAILLIDPFAGQSDLGNDSSQGLLKDALALTQTLPQQTRYDTQDILLALDDNVFSRFMISASRAGVSGGAALATSGLDAFLGFTCAAFRRHDYLLGRANCQQFLLNEFVLPVGAAAFGNGWNGVPTADFEVDLRDGDPNSGKALPIIPLLGTAAVIETMVPWPKGALDPENFRDGIESRFAAIVNAGLTGSFGKRLAAWLVNQLADGSVADYVIGEIKAALTTLGL
jgi:hypothetical protein